MYTQAQQQNYTESVDTTTEERDSDEEKDENYNENRRFSTFNVKQYQQQQDLSTSNNGAFSIPNLSVPTGNDQSAILIAELLHEANLTDLIQLDTINQIKYFLDERIQLIEEADLVRTHYEQQYILLRHRLDQVENENERLTLQHRSSSKQLLLYKNLVEAPDNPELPTKSKDYQQLKLTIEEIIQENEYLHSELNHFKTSDPVYEQVQLLEKANKHLQKELNQSINNNNRLKQMINLDETQHLKMQLSKTLEECEQLKIANKKLTQQQMSSLKQVHIYPSPPSSLSNQQQHHHHSQQQQQQFSPISNHSSRSIEENLSTDYSSNDAAELREHVQRLEQTLQKRDYELKNLQNEIEKGTNSIMSSIEDLYIASSNISSPINTSKHQPSNDKLDELTHENQILKIRLQEIDTIYQENENLYAEKSQWTEEIERMKIHQLSLEQELNKLKQHEKELILTNDSTMTINTSNISQLQLGIDWLNRTNIQFEREVIHLREQIDLITQSYEQDKRDLIEKNQHYKQMLQATQDTQKLPEELIRIEKHYAKMETQFEHERQEYEEKINVLMEQNEKKEQNYSSLHDTFLKVQNDYRQKELDFVRQMDEIVKEQDTLHTQLTFFQNLSEQLQQENQALKQELNSKNEINRDLKLALTSSNHDTQNSYIQLHQLNINLTELQEKYNNDVTEYNSQIEMLRTVQKRMITHYDSELLQTHQSIIQLQHDNNQCSSQLERYRLNIDKLQTEINEKQNFIEQLQNDLSDRSALHVSINNQLLEENKAKITKITELEQALSQEQQQKIELQQTIEDLLQSRTRQEESVETNEKFEQNFINSNEPTRRELHTLRNELITKSDQNTMLQHSIEDEQLKRQRLEMKLKRLKDEYINVRTDLYNRIEENNELQHELIEYRLKIDYYSQINNQAMNSIKSPDEMNSSTVIPLYLKEKADNLHCQLKCRTYQQQFEQLQKKYDFIKEKYKQRSQEEQDIFERARMKYVGYIKNIQKDLQEARRLLEQDAQIKMNQELAYQELIDQQRQLLTNMVDKDAKEREMRRENLLLTSKIQLLENQMGNFHDRIDLTVREQSQLRRDVNSVRLDINVSSETSASSSPLLSSRRTTITYIDSTGYIEPVFYTESFGFNNGQPNETSAVS